MDSLRDKLTELDTNLKQIVKEVDAGHIVLSDQHADLVRSIHNSLLDIRKLDIRNEVLSGVKLKDIGSKWNPYTDF